MNIIKHFTIGIILFLAGCQQYQNTDLKTFLQGEWELMTVTIGGNPEPGQQILFYFGDSLRVTSGDGSLGEYHMTYLDDNKTARRVGVYYNNNMRLHPQHLDVLEWIHRISYNKIDIEAHVYDIIVRARRL